MKIKKFVIFWLPAYAYAVIIFLVSSRPKILPEIEWFPYLDKLIHTIEYAILGLLLVRALWNYKYASSIFNCCILAVILSVLYGISDEIHQYFVPYRDFSIPDILFDGIGAFLGTLLYTQMLERMEECPAAIKIFKTRIFFNRRNV